MLRVYLDNCTFNRPFDDQHQIRVRLEAEAKLYVQAQIKQGNIELIWSYILAFENKQNPFEERKRVIEKWQAVAKVDINESPKIIATAKLFIAQGLKAKDALHVASAIEGNADYFLTTDDKIVRKLSDSKKIHAVNPVDIIKLIDNYDN